MVVKGSEDGADVESHFGEGRTLRYSREIFVCSGGRVEFFWCCMLLLACMASDRVEAALSMPCMSGLLRILSSVSDLTSDGHPPIVTQI